MALFKDTLLRKALAVGSALALLASGAYGFTDLSFDTFTLLGSGTRSTDPDYDTGSTEPYVGRWLDQDTNIAVQVTLLNLNGAEAESFTYNEDNETGVQQNPPANVSLGIDDTGGDSTTLFSHYLFEFQDASNDFEPLAPANYRITVYDLDYKTSDSNRIESVLFPDSLVNNVQRFNADGQVTTQVYQGSFGVRDPTGNPNVTYVQQSDGGEINGTDFTKFQGLANWDSDLNEATQSAAPQGAVSVLLTDVDSFEMITMIEGVTGDPGMRAIVDFSDPPDSGEIIPEPSMAWMAGVVVLLAVYRRR